MIKLLLPLFALLLVASPASAEKDARPFTLNVSGALVTIPNSEVSLEIGSGVSNLHAAQAYNGDITIEMTVPTAQTGFIIKNVSSAIMKVTFAAKDEMQPREILPSTVNESYNYSFLPPNDIATGGVFTIVIFRQPMIERKKKKGFLQ